jgi:hypothetical protein
MIILAILPKKRKKEGQLGGFRPARLILQLHPLQPSPRVLECQLCAQRVDLASHPLDLVRLLNLRATRVTRAWWKRRLRPREFGLPLGRASGRVPLFGLTELLSIKII